MADYEQGVQNTNEIIRSVSPMLERLADILRSPKPTGCDTVADTELRRVVTSLLEVHERQWELETSCREVELGDPELGRLKRAIDESNVRRVSLINALDSATQECASDPHLNTLPWPLTIGQMIDHLLIAGLRVYKCNPPLPGATDSFAHAMRSLEAILSFMEEGTATLPPTSTIKVYLRQS